MVRDVGAYRLEELIGYGGSGEVWRARHRRTGAVVALKRLRGIGVVDQERQLREAALLAALSHPHLVALQEVLTDHGETVLVLDHLGGGSLASLLARRGRLSAPEVVATIAPLAAALAYAHDEGLVHGDVTVGNVLFTVVGRPVLTDLGVARVLGDDGEVAATAEYIDPVVAQGGVPGPASDVFGLAAVAFHALTGVPPWNAASAESALALAATGEVPDLHQLAPDAPTDLLDVVARAMSARPELRGGATEFALDVRHSCRPQRVDLSADGPLPLGPPSSAGVTHVVRVPRQVGSGPAHARPRVTRLQLAAQGLQRRLPVRRSRDLAAVAVVFALVGGAVLVGAAWGSPGDRPASALRDSTLGASGGTEGSPAGGTPVAGSAAAGTAAADRIVAPADPQQWLAVLGVLYDRRATAFTAADSAALDGVYTAGSAQRASDAAEIERLRRAGQALQGFRPQVLSIDRAPPPAQLPASQVSLGVTDEYTGYAVTGSDGVRQVWPGRAAAPVQIALTMTANGWRIESALRLPSGG